jgi:hypothetical protein
MSVIKKLNKNTKNSIGAELAPGFFVMGILIFGFMGFLMMCGVR